jgi:hypothetical protein
MKRILLSPPTVVALAVLACAGCETFSPAQTCDMSQQDNPPVTFVGGAALNGVYMSSPWAGTASDPWLVFPGGMQYTLEHHLGAVPQWQELWVTFSPDGTGGGSSIAQAAGNEAQIVGVDATAIEVANFSCSEYYLLVVAGVAGSPPTEAALSMGESPSPR